MKIDLSKYRLGSQQKTECRCGAKVYFLMSLTSDVSLFFLCTECGQIARPVPGGRKIIAEGDEIAKEEETADFNKLSSNDKWDTWKDQKGTWHCRYCGTELSDGPQSAGPFARTTVHCGNCDAELTRRHGGGQNEPFNWILKEKKCNTK